MRQQSHATRERIDLIQQQVAETRRMNATLERIAEIMEKRAQG